MRTTMIAAAMLLFTITCLAQERPYLGVQVDQQYQGKGVKISKVLPGTSAAKAGFKDGDVIIEAGGKAVTSFDDLVATLQGRKIGDVFAATVKRGEKTLKLSAKLGPRPKQPRGPGRMAQPEGPPTEEDYDRTARRAARRDSFPVLDNPKMTAAADAKLSDSETIVGLTIKGEAKAYPMSVLGRHELINDTCGKDPIAVSW